MRETGTRRLERMLTLTTCCFLGIFASSTGEFVEASHSALSRLLFPAFVAPAMTTCTPLRSRSPLRSSFRCRSISARRSNTAPSTSARGVGWGVSRRGERGKTGRDAGFALTFLASSEGLERFEAQEVLLSPVARRRNGSQTCLFQSGKLKIQ